MRGALKMLQASLLGAMVALGSGHQCGRGRFQRQDDRVRHSVRGRRRVGRVGPVLRAAAGPAPSRQAGRRRQERAGRRLDHRHQPVSGARQAGRADPARHVRIDAVPLSSGRPARPLRIPRLDPASCLADRRRRLCQSGARREGRARHRQAQGQGPEVRQPGRDLARPGAASCLRVARARRQGGVRHGAAATAGWPSSAARRRSTTRRPRPTCGTSYRWSTPARPCRCSRGACSTRRASSSATRASRTCRTSSRPTRWRPASNLPAPRSRRSRPSTPRASRCRS